MRILKSTSAALISLSLLSANAAQAAAPCTTPNEWAALRSAAVQQELMVAGLTCHAIDSYNRFVIGYRAELQASDADLKAYFIKRNGMRGEAAYDTFKTKLANLSSLSEISNVSGFCAATRAAFNQVGRQNLDGFVAGQRLLIELPEQQLCAADPAMPVMASMEPMPASSTRMAAVEPPARKNPPASPYGTPTQRPTTRTAPAAAYQQPPDANDGDEDEDYGDAVPIPPAYQAPQPPGVIQAQRGQAYGGPRVWAPPPYPRWADRAPNYYGR
jgi:hypothetical protein